MPGGCATMCVKSEVILTLGSTSIVDNRVIQLLELFEQSGSFSMATNPKFVSFTSRQLNRPRAPQAVYQVHEEQVNGHSYLVK